MELNIPGYTPPPKTEPDKKVVLEQSPKPQDLSSIPVADNDPLVEKTTPAPPTVTMRAASKPQAEPISNEPSTSTSRDSERPSYKPASTEPPRRTPRPKRRTEPPKVASEPPGVLLLPGNVQSETPQQAVLKPTPEELFAKAMGADIFQVIANWEDFE